MKKIQSLLIVVSLLLAVSGCIAPPKPPKVETVKKRDKNIEVAIKKGSYQWCSSNPNSGFSTKYDFDFQGISVNIKNKTDKTIEIDWNKSSYILNGGTHNGFMYGGVKYNERNNINRRPDYVMPKYSYNKVVLPNMLAEWVPPYKGQGGGWTNKCLPAKGFGSGILLVYRIDGKEFMLPVTLK